MATPTLRGPYPRPRLRVVSANRKPELDSGEFYIRIGGLLGAVGACVAFFGAYVAAINSTGWVIGLAVGWITAWLAAVVAFVILRHLWPLGVVLLIALLR
jgi:hypothetical protein